MSANDFSQDPAREILDLDAADATSVKGGKKGSFDITNDAQLAGDPSQWDASPSAIFIKLGDV